MMGLLKNEYVIFALIAVAIFTVYMSVVAIVRKDPMRERIKRVMPVDVPGVGFEYEENQSSLAIFCTNLLIALGTDLAQAKRDLYVPLAQAGLMSSGAVVYYLFFKRFMQPAFLVLSAIAFWQLLALDADADFTVKLLYIILAAVFAVIGIFGTKLYLSNRRAKRQAVLQKSFTDALDLLLVCVESGLPLDGALARVTRELKTAHPEITAELDRTRVELNVLNDRVQALQNLAERTDTQGFKTLVAALIQTEKFGTSIADTLRSLSEEYRTSRMLHAENKAARIPALITVPLIFFIMPAFMLIIMGPPWINISQQGGLFGNNQESRR